MGLMCNPNDAFSLLTRFCAHKGIPCHAGMAVGDYGIVRIVPDVFVTSHPGAKRTVL